MTMTYNLEIFKLAQNSLPLAYKHFFQSEQDDANRKHPTYKTDNKQAPKERGPYNSGIFVEAIVIKHYYLYEVNGEYFRYTHESV